VAGYVGAPDRAFFREQERRVSEWGLQDRVSFLGEVDRSQKLALLQRIDILSVPTTYREPKGLYVLEALAHGVPVVQPRHGAFPELIEATGGGRLVESGSPAALAAGLRELILDADLRRQLGERGRAAVEERFDHHAMAERTVEVYRSVLGRP
jgi:glycosyltransferase involved in cell wall biosynthesis